MKVNGLSLIGETHKEVVRILKELPLCVTMICCRPAPHLQTDMDAVQPETFLTASKLKVTFGTCHDTQFVKGCYVGKKSLNELKAIIKQQMILSNRYRNCLHPLKRQ